jgi:hypothetical protein
MTSNAVHEPLAPVPARASRPVRTLAWTIAAGCLAFAAVNVAFETTGRFADGPHAESAAGLSAMNWIVTALKLLGAIVAIRAVHAPRPTAVRTTLVWGAAGLLGLYSAGSVVQLVVLLLSDPNKIDLLSLAYLAFFLAAAIGYGVIAVSYSRRTQARRSHAVLGVLGAPLMLGALLVAAPAVLTAMGLISAP